MQRGRILVSPTDVSQVPSEHAPAIIGNHWPQHSESDTVSKVIELYERAAESLGTADTAEAMYALIETNASGQTPTHLVEDFTAEQRKAFDAAAAQLAQGQTASVMAQDILNTKVALNGTVTSFEAAVQELIAEAAAQPQTPKTQAEFQRRYEQLLDEAKEQARTLGDNHRETQEALIAGVQRGVIPDIPSTMAPTSTENPTVPGMPENALGSVLQNVAGQMMKPGSLPMPNLNQLTQSAAPLAQSAQQALGQLMSSLSGMGGAGAGVPVSDDALSVLASTANAGDQNQTLSAPGSAIGAGLAAGAGAGSGGLGSPSGSTRPVAGGLTDTTGDKSGTLANGLTAGSPHNERVSVPLTDAPAAPPATAAPSVSVPATTLSSGEAVIGPDPLSSARTHTSGGDAASATSTLTPTATAAAPAAAAAGMPMMPMMTGLGAPHGGSPAASRNGNHVHSDAEQHRFVPAATPVPEGLDEFGNELKGLEHATERQQMAGAVLAALVRAHDREGYTTHIAVGVSGGTILFATSDGLGFLPPGVRCPRGVAPLISRVPESFVSRWLGCDQPWRPLLEAAELGIVEEFDAVVSTDTGGVTEQVLAVTDEQLSAVNASSGSQERWDIDAIDAEDLDPVLLALDQAWQRPRSSAADLENLVWRSRWNGDSGPGDYPQRWAHYLLAAARSDIAAGDVDDARYALRTALRVPEPREV